MKNLVSAAVVALCLTTGANATQFIQNGDFASNGGNGQFNYTTSATGWYVPDIGNGTYVFLFQNGTADTTGANGQYDATIGIRLPAGPYEVRFYVKDTADFKIILYRDFFKFQVD